jgi:DNA polymerase-3 subunit gamma/tau
MLTKEAFNALLKTLEEPPEHVKFIFATTEPQKIPITILSRCQRFDFAGISSAAIQARLSQIAAAEGVEVEPEALQILAGRAAGSMRDSQSLLEQLLAAGHRRINAAEVNQLLGIAPAERLDGLVQRLVVGDAAGALVELDAALADGVEAGLLLDQLVGYFRDVLVTAVGCSADQLLYALPSQSDSVAEVGRRLGLSTILAISQILDQTAARMRVSMYGRTLVEMAVVRICQLGELDDLAVVIAELRGAAGENGSSRMPPTDARKKNAELPQPRAKSTSLTPNPTTGPRGVDELRERRLDAREPLLTNEIKDDARLAALPAALTDADAAELWQRTIREIGDTLAGSAAHADRVTAAGDNLVVASFPAVYSFCRDTCDRPDTRARLERLLSDAHGGPIRLKLDVHAGDPAAATTPRPSPSSRRARLAEVGELPFVRRAMELFDVPAGQLRYAPPDGER